MPKLSSQSLHKLPEVQQAAILNLLLAGVKPTPGFAWTQDSLLSQLKSDRGEVLFQAENPVAFVIWRDLQTEAEIFSLMTAPSYQHQGLMTQLLKIIFDANSHVRTWWLEVHEANIEALNLYKKLGFEIHGHRDKYYSDGARAVIFKRAISS